MLEKKHESHQGIVKSKQRARDLLFWPGMMTQVEEQVAKCFKCSQYQTTHAKEPMIITESPERPWSKIAADFFEYQGNSYLLCLDYYSKWIEVNKLDDLTSKNTISYLKSHPHYTQASGEVERAVQTVKTLLKKGADPYQALLNYRNTKLEKISLSPAQLPMGRILILENTTNHCSPTQTTGCQRNKTHPRENEGEGKTATSTVAESCHHYTRAMLSECNMANNRKQQQSYTNKAHLDLMLFRHLMAPSIAEIGGTYMSRGLQPLCQQKT
ncbi:hypothetical protein ACROYT_G015855 [Oculina patagonica]